MIDLRRLRAFVAVAEEGHVTRAAERLGMRQPPLTRLVRGLEDELGVTLLTRLPRGVEPTEAGLSLLDEARAVLARAAAVEATVRRAARGEQGRLAVGFTSSAALHPFVPAALRQFRAGHPGVRLELDEAGTGELTQAVQEGRLDAAFVRSAVAAGQGLAAETVLDEPMIAAIPVGHLLADVAGPLPLAALAGAPFVLYRRPAGPGLYDAIVAACRRAGFTPGVVQEAPRLPATLSLVAAGLGISFVPASMRRLAIDGVIYRDLDAGAGLTAPLRLVVRHAATVQGTGATATRFRDTVRELAAPSKEDEQWPARPAPRSNR